MLLAYAENYYVRMSAFSIEGKSVWFKIQIRNVQMSS